MFSFPRAGRLRNQHDFQSVFSKSYKVAHHHLVALCKPNQLKQARLGIIITKRLVKSAIERNLIRRIIRESFRHHQATIKELDIIVLMRSKYESSSLQKSSKAILRNDVDNLWQRLLHAPAYNLNKR